MEEEEEEEESEFVEDFDESDLEDIEDYSLEMEMEGVGAKKKVKITEWIRCLVLGRFLKIFYSDLQLQL